MTKIHLVRNKVDIRGVILTTLIIPDPLIPLRYILQSLEDHLEHLQSKLIIDQSAVYIHEQSREHYYIDKLSLVTDALYYTFHVGMRKKPPLHFQ